MCCWIGAGTRSTSSGASRANGPPTCSNCSCRIGYAPFRAICSTIASISGRPRWLPRIATCHPARTSSDRSTSSRAYSSVRGSRRNMGFLPGGRASDNWTLVLLERAEKVFDVERGQRLDARRPTCAECDRHLRHGGDVGGFDDVDEVELAEGRPLVQDFAAELGDVLVHLAEALRIRLEGLYALLCQRRQKNVERHPARTLLHERPGRHREGHRPGRGAD